MPAVAFIQAHEQRWIAHSPPPPCRIALIYKLWLESTCSYRQSLTCSYSKHSLLVSPPSIQTQCQINRASGYPKCWGTSLLPQEECDEASWSCTGHTTSLPQKEFDKASWLCTGHTLLMLKQKQSHSEAISLRKYPPHSKIHTNSVRVFIVQYKEY